MKIAFFGKWPGSLEAVYSSEQRERLRGAFEVVPVFVGPDNFDVLAPDLATVRAIFSTWGMMRLDGEQLSRMPALQILFYGAGSVQGFAGPLLERGVRISGGWKINGEAVAEFTLGQILLACKGYFRNTRDYAARRTKEGCARGPGAYGETLALLGGGAIARRLIALLGSFDLNILLYDPFIDEPEAARLGVRKAELAECFEKAGVVSNHIPNMAGTQKMLTGELFARMRAGATFINTARGATVENDGFIKVFAARPDLTALLDVTDPEPLPPDSPIFGMPNIQLSTHIAGAINSEQRRIGDRMIDAFFNWVQHGTVRDEITADMLARMA